MTKADKIRAAPMAPMVVGGMSSQAHNTFDRHRGDMTKEELGVSDKKIIIPSFDTTGKLFAQHFHILRELKYKIDLLKQACEDQRSDERSWEQIDDIRKVLNQACYFLDFPEDNEIQQRMIRESIMSEMEGLVQVD